MSEPNEVSEPTEKELLEAANRPLTGRDQVEEGDPSGSTLANAFAWIESNGTRPRWLVACRKIWEWLLEYSALPELLEGMPEGHLWGAKIVLVDETKFVVLGEDLACRAFVVSKGEEHGR